jgi:hypothetical protein
MGSDAVHKRVSQLAALLEDIHGLYDELHGVIQRKLEGMRRADAEAMSAASSRERFLTGRLRERDGLRKQLLEHIGSQLGLDPGAARCMTVSEVASHVGEPLAGRLSALAASIRPLMQRTAEANRVAALAGREVLGHFRRVYTTLAASGAEPGTYSRSGRAEALHSTRVFEVTG